MSSTCTGRVRFKGDEMEIIFEHGSGTPNRQFKIVEGNPTFIFEESDYEPNYNAGKRYEEVFQWDGKKFAKRQ